MKRINLLPPEQRVKASRDRRLVYAVGGLAVLVLLLGGVYFQQRSVVADKQAELDRLNADIQVTQAKIAALRPYAEIHNLRTAMNETAQNIYAARVPWSNILEEVSLVIPDNVRLQNLTCKVPPVMLPGPKQAAPVNATPALSTDVTFTGVTYTHKDVAEFMTRLGLIPQLTNIQLTSSTGTQSTTDASSTKTVNFTITASLRAYLKAPPMTTLQTGAGQ